VRPDRASPVKQGEHQEYIDLLSLSRQSLQNKQCFHNQLYAYLSAARNTVKNNYQQRRRARLAIDFSTDRAHVSDVLGACVMITSALHSYRG
jgi:hypothetical protein